MSARKIRRELYSNDFIGVVADINDPKRLGRVRVRVERLHGREGDKSFIPTNLIPWYEPSSRGSSYFSPAVGSVVYLCFEDDDYYKGSWFAQEHYDINLQKKLESLSDADYQNFSTTNFGANHQYYTDTNDGLMFDYVKSNFNIRPNGDIRLNLKDSDSKMYIGTEDADQQMLLANHWMDFFDELMDNLGGINGGPYIGNMGSPVLPHPKMLEIYSKYKAFRETFLSKYVYCVDNNKVKAQKRGFDDLQNGDNWNTENNMKPVNKPKTTLPPTVDRPATISNPDNGNMPPNNAINNLSTSKNPTIPTSIENAKFISPFGDNGSNGQIPLSSLTVSKYLAKSFTSDNDERKYLIDESAKNLDDMIDQYNTVKKSNWNDIVATKGYQNLERQQTTRKNYPMIAPNPGSDPFGYANQVELYFGVDKSDTALTDAIKDYLNNGTINSKYNQIYTLDWLKNNSEKFNFQLAGRTSTGDVQWWHWIYLKTEKNNPNTTNT